MDSASTLSTTSLVRQYDLGVAIVLAAMLLPARWRELQRCVVVGECMADSTTPFERPHVEGARCRVLVVGDSTGVGTGADHARDSLAGRLATDFPDVAIVNRARNGARTRDACRQLDAVTGQRFDVVLIHVGGNDVLRRTPLRELSYDVEELLRRACRAGAHVLITTTPNVGLAPAFDAPLSWWLTRRSRQVRDLFAAASRRHGAHYANFFHPRAHDPFSREAQRYFAADRVHPSSECYAYVYRSLLHASPLAHWLTAPSAAPDFRAHVDELREEGDVQRLAEEAHAG